MLGRFDKTLGAAEIGEFKGALGGGGGHGELLRSECPETEPIFGQSEGTPGDPIYFECLKGSGVGAQKWRTER